MTYAFVLSLLGASSHGPSTGRYSLGVPVFAELDLSASVQLTSFSAVRLTYLLVICCLLGGGTVALFFWYRPDSWPRFSVALAFLIAVAALSLTAPFGRELFHTPRDQPHFAAMGFGVSLWLIVICLPAPARSYSFAFARFYNVHGMWCAIVKDSGRCTVGQSECGYPVDAGCRLPVWYRRRIGISDEATRSSCSQIMGLRAGQANSLFNLPLLVSDKLIHGDSKTTPRAGVGLLLPWISAGLNLGSFIQIAEQGIVTVDSEVPEFSVDFLCPLSCGM